MKSIKTSLLYHFLSTLFLGIIFLCYAWGDTIVSILDFTGWLFFITSCFSHAALLMLALWLVFYLPFRLLRFHRIAVSLFVTSTALLSMSAFINMQVYRIYRFHINGFIMNLLTGPGAGEIFDFDAKLYLTEGLSLLLIVAVNIALWWASVKLSPRFKKPQIALTTCLLLGSLVIANGIHVYGSFILKPSIVKSVRLIPYYFPLSATSLMMDMGFERKVFEVDGSLDGEGDLVYPLHELQVAEDSVMRPNVILILIDAWSKQAFNEECMPNLFRLAHEEQWYDNHVSCSNGTRYGVFGLFTSLQPYYYTVFETNRTSPLLIDQLIANDYDFRAYPSATLRAPDFRRILFHRLPNLRTDTEGSSSYERDMRLKDDFIGDLPALKRGEKPFFAFLFFDLLHAYSLPKELLTKFQPSWEYGKFDELHNDMDPTPFWNLYRNSAVQTDKMVGEVISQLKAQGMYDNTLIFITGDHAQEYNENHKNYWGHNSNFSTYQIGVPFIVHEPGDSVPHHFTHRTTHYDVVPTLMHDYLGVTNPVEDYSVGRLLSDTTPRLWHFVGNELRYAFLVEGDTILTKEGAGYIDVTDSHLNPVENYHIKPKDFDKAIKELNRFLK